MQDKIMLSIIMLTVPERKREFKRLYKKVTNQIFYCSEVHPSLGGVEALKIETPRYLDGGPTIGVKRTTGIKWAEGKYIMWLDDDDDISPDYVETVLRLCLEGADVCTFSSLCKFENFWCIVDMDLRTKTDQQACPGVVNRRPYHVCAWRRELIEDCKFPNKNWDEDAGFLLQALPRCQTQAKSISILHEYRNYNSLARETL